MLKNNTNNLRRCYDCEAVENIDFLSTYDLGDKGRDLVRLCDKCLSNYPKHDSRDWRTEDHPDANGVVTWNDGSRSFVGLDGIIREAQEVTI